MKHTFIRYAQISDLSDLIRLFILHTKYEKTTYCPNEKELELKKHLFSENPPLYCLVLECNGNIVGYATYMVQFSSWNADYYMLMDCLYLEEHVRGNGFGKAIMNKIKRDAEKLNCSQVQWQTPSFNNSAIKFYNRFGGSFKSKKRYFLNI